MRKGLFKEIGLYIVMMLVIFTMASVADAQFGSSTNRVIESPADIELKPDATVEVFGDLLIRDRNSLLFEDDGASNYTVNLLAPTALASTYTLTLPGADGTNGQAITTDGSGNLSFTSIADNFDVLTLTEQGSTPATPSSGLKKIYCKTDDSCYQLNDAGEETELGAGGAGNVFNLIADPGYEDGADTWTHGSGSGVATTTGGIFETAYLSLQTGTAHQHDLCFAVDTYNLDEVNGDIEVGTFIKTTLTDLEYCWYDGTNEDQCDTYTAGLNEWVYVYKRQKATATESACLRLNSPSTSAIGVDNSHIGTVKFNTAELVDKQKTYSEAGGDFAITGSDSWATTNAEATVIEGVDGGVWISYTIEGTTTSAASPNLVFSGVDFAYAQSCNAASTGTAAPNCFTNTTTGLFPDDSTGRTTWYLSSTNKLDGLPTWAVSPRSTNVITPTTSTSLSKSTSSNTTAVTTGTTTFLGFGATATDVDSNFSNVGSANNVTYTSTTYYTAPFKGDYVTHSRIFTGDTDLDVNESMLMAIAVNGTTVSDDVWTIAESYSGPDLSFSIFDVIPLEKGDIVSISLLHQAGADIALNASATKSVFSVFPISGNAIWAGAEIVTSPGQGGKLVSVHCRINNNGTASLGGDTTLCTGWQGTPSRSVLGRVTVDFDPNFATEPVCQVIARSAGNVNVEIQSISNSTAGVATFTANSGTDVDNDFMISCWGRY